MYMMMLVLDDPAYLDKILDAWSLQGVSGATIMESSGLHRRRLKRIPMRYAYGDSSEESGNLSLFAVVADQKKAQECLHAVEQIVGDLDKPNTGVFSAWPVAISKGIPAHGDS